MNTFIEENAFYVLALPVTATRAEIEREGPKWLGMLELNLSEARFYQTPFGAKPRTPELVRNAMAILRNPEQRLLQELWAKLAPTISIPNQTEEQIPSFSIFSALGLTAPNINKEQP